MKKLALVLVLVWISGWLTGKAFSGTMVTSEGEIVHHRFAKTVIIKQGPPMDDILIAPKPEKKREDQPIIKIYKRHPGSHVKSWRFV